MAPLCGGGGPGGGGGCTGGPDKGCWEFMGIPLPFAPGPILPLRGTGLGAPPGADMVINKSGEPVGNG